MVSFIKQVAKRHKKESIENQSAIGYWLVRKSDNKRFFISEQINIYKLEQVGEKVLSDEDYHYWIDYCFGKDINGVTMWANYDHTNSFF